MKISIVGTRGIPAKYGGFETFAEEISSLFTREGIEVSVQCDHNSYSHDNLNGVQLFFSSVTKSDHPLLYYYEGLKWSLKHSDIILIATYFGSPFYFLNLFRKKPIITNPDGIEYKRGKWPLMIKIYIRISELLAVIFSDYLIADSENIKKYLSESYRFAEKKIRLIEYGAYPNNEPRFEVLKKYGLKHDNYYLIVCRIEPENNLDMILTAYQKAKTNRPIVITGNILNTKYEKRLMNRYSSERIRFLSGIYDKQELNGLRYSCKAYIHGHSVGGTNPSLLEAMANHNLILAHDNIFNREVTADKQLYFKNTEQCTERINEIELMTADEINIYKELGYDMIIHKYNWEKILKKYLDFFRDIDAL